MESPIYVTGSAREREIRDALMRLYTVSLTRGATGADWLAAICNAKRVLDRTESNAASKPAIGEGVVVTMEPPHVQP